jgi:hypothetical protein
MYEGKQFESDIRKSVPDYILIQRLHDTSQSYQKSKDTKFTPKNPCDYLLYDSIFHNLYALELKTTKYKSIAFEDIDSDKEQNKMIHKHQIIALTRFSEFDGVIAGFVCNFRDEKNNMERTYFQNIIDFNNMRKKINKFSFNEMDLILNGAIKIDGEKKRVHYTWNLDKFFSEYGGV